MKTFTNTISSTESLKAHLLEQVFAEVVLGRPSADCRHLGICKIERLYTNDFFPVVMNSFCNSSDKVYALTTLRKDAYVELAFQRAFMNAASFDMHFKKGVFLMEEDFMLNDEFFSTPARLRAGTYKVKFSDRLLTVRFEL